MILIFEKSTKKTIIKVLTLRLFSETRWTVRGASLTSIYENYKELEELWDWCLDKYKDTEPNTQIHDAQSQMQMCEYFCTETCYWSP